MSNRPTLPAPILTLSIVFALLVVPSCSLSQNLFPCLELGTRTSDHAQILAGKDGWLFTDTDLRDEFPFEPTLPFFERLSQALAGKGVVLVVLVIPTRGMVYEEWLPDKLPDNLEAASMPEARDRYRELLAALEGVDIIAPDILASTVALQQAGGTFFFRLDHHWTPAGARAAAQATATEIQLASLDYDQLEKTTFETNLAGTVPNEGSYLRTVNEVCGIELEDEALDQFVTTLAQSGGAGLFTDIATEAVLVGTSFSNRTVGQRDFNLSGFLSQFLSLNTSNDALGAGGPFAALEAYLLDDTRPQPSYLIWEIPARNFPAVDGFRQLTPAVNGPCTPEDALFATTSGLETDSSPLFEVSGLELPPEGGYFYLEFEDLGIVNFDAMVRFDSESTTYPLRRSTRVPNQGRFFLDLPDRGGETVDDVDLRIRPRSAAQGDVTIRICANQEP